MTKKTGPFRLSACMMVKDEEANLARCLQSIKPLIDELIIVDTGSSDRTVQIAESFGASIYHHAWADDFSLHRNQSIAPATGDWILIIDADEEFVFGQDGVTYVRETLKHAKDKDAFAVVMKNIQGNFVTSQTIHPRFFRNGKISYTGIVHNQPVFKGTARLLGMSDVYLNHYGYSVENIEKKAMRTIPLLKKELKENPKKNGNVIFIFLRFMETYKILKKQSKWVKFTLAIKMRLMLMAVRIFKNLFIPVYSVV